MYMYRKNSLRKPKLYRHLTGRVEGLGLYKLVKTLTLRQMLVRYTKEQKIERPYDNYLTLTEF